MAITLDQPLDPRSPEAVAFLAGIQGNILKSHGRDHAAHVFATFGSDAAAARAWLAEAAHTRITSGKRQKKDRDVWASTVGAGELFTGVLLSYTGYQALGVEEATIPVDPSGNYFRLGMKRQAEAPRTYNDPPANEWEEPFRGRPDILIILAHDDPAQLAQAVARFRAELVPFTTAIWVETGQRLEYAFEGSTKPSTIEHFGFVDGISNPLFFTDDIAEERQLRGYSKWDPAAPLKLALTIEPGHPDRYGSFMVFRKLEQNVAGFRQALKDLAQTGAGTGLDAERAGALAVGRFRNGTPILAMASTLPPEQRNDFHFKLDDVDGAQCPFHAHIRKTNPRGDTPLPSERERLLRIARRGITYGARSDLAAGSALPAPSVGVGLLFMSYQAQLEQFAIQQEGSDSNDFARDNVGVDAVIGQHSSPVPQEWPPGSGVRFTIANFVKLLGGEYFFAPSIAFLSSLSIPASPLRT